MSIKKKIILIFSASFAIVAIFGIIATFDVMEVRRDFAYLEISDSIRSKTLQMRRHEKNYLLFGEKSEIIKIENSFSELDTLIERGITISHNDKNLQRLIEKIYEYRESFRAIKKLANETAKRMDKISSDRYKFAIPLMKASFIEHPDIVATLLKQYYSAVDVDPLITNLVKIHKQIQELRSAGESIIDISRSIDKAARMRVQNVIDASETGTIIVFPAAFLAGFIALFAVTHNIVKRLKKLMVTIKKTGEGFYSPLPFPAGKDEISTLIKTYNNMAEALREHEEQLIKKEEELIRHRKLAAIGTLASGVAHELNNPLNNIHISAQILSQEIHNDNVKLITETVDDILSQSIRVKKIISELLEFARDRAPEKSLINLPDLIRRVYEQISKLSVTDGIRFVINSPEDLKITADSAQIERVFVNLINNAIDAMGGKGEISVNISNDEDVGCKNRSV
jgi:light-regulated signal transduction histidine kinase (bacteriophytochrome)